MDKANNIKFGHIPGYLAEILREFIDSVANLNQPDATERFNSFEQAFKRLRKHHRRLFQPDGLPWRPLTLNPYGIRELLQTVRDVAIKAQPWEITAESDVLKQQKARKAFDEFLEIIETRWCRPDSFRHRWSFFTSDDHPVSVIAFPCRVQQGRESWGAIYYLTAMVESGPPVWRFAGFAQTEESYFVLDSLARHAIGIVADVDPDQVPPSEINKLRQNFNFLVLYRAFSDLRSENLWQHSGWQREPERGKKGGRKASGKW